MSNFELIDDYLTNRLSEQDRKSFEQQLATDPSLKTEVELQSEIIHGLKTARIAELKAMLNKVPVSSTTLNFSPLQIAAGLLGAAVITTGLYFYINRDSGEVSKAEQITSSQVIDSAGPTEQKNIENKTENTPTESTPVDKQSESKDNNPSEPRPAEKTIQPGTPPVQDSKAKPVIDLVDPTGELSTEKEISPVKSGANNSTISVAKIGVDVVSSERKFKSHYQFEKGRLVLYGDFDKGLYEIIEVNSHNARSLFLYYKNIYYLLDEAQQKVTPLKEITDPVLIQKLKSFRSQ